MQNIHRLRALKKLTEQQALTAFRFYRSPRSFHLAPTMFRFLRQVIIDEIPLEKPEAERGWPARSAKAILGFLLHCIEEVEGAFWTEMSEAERAELLKLQQEDEFEERAGLAARFNLTNQQSWVLHALVQRCGKTVSKSALVEYSGLDEGASSDPFKQLTVIICVLRRKIRKSDWDIETQTGLGYRLVTKSASTLQSANTSPKRESAD